MMRIIYIIISSSLPLFLFSQAPVAHYEMDCNLIEINGAFDDIDTPFFPNCECAVENDGLIITDNVDLTFDTLISDVFEDDFAISFYFQPSINTNAQELISVGNNCSSDSLLRIFYLSGLNEVIFEVSETIQESVTLRAEVDLNKCWNHIIVSRENNDFFLYINGELGQEIKLNNDIVLDVNEPVRFGHGPCVGIISNEFEGLVDDIKFFNQHIQEFRARELYKQNQEVTTSDTTIFIGDVIDVNAVGNCFDNVIWSPSLGTNRTDTTSIMIEGIETTDYIVSFTENGCISNDTFKLIVVDPDEIQCDDLILPNVFTPNNDGVNDNFGILNPFIVESMKSFEIFDRWGEIVYSSSDKQQRWDGKYKDKRVASSMFLYKIVYTCDGKEIAKTGNVSIMR